MTSALSVPGILRTYALPALWIFALPVFSLWFTGHAREWLDQTILTNVERQLTEAQDLDAETRQGELDFFRAVPASAACLSSDEQLAGYREMLGKTCSDYEQFEGMGWVSLGSVAVGLFSTVIALLCALAAFASRPLQYAGFAVGWNVLRITGALQALAQGALAVWLSYWMTAVWFEVYAVKLILIVGVLAAGAVFYVLRGIFRRPPKDSAVEAEVVEPERAPELWAHVRGLCEKLGTPPPDYLLAGIDTNFFVTESEVRVGERTLEGRTLYVSLSLLRMLERSEADAVLAHEMAHLLGGDTGHSKRLAPMITRFEQYLWALSENPLTWPIMHFMVAYLRLFELSLGRSRRASELAADRLSAGITSGRDIARSLVKVGAYSSFRERVESTLFSEGQQHESVEIAQRVALGFAQYAGSESVHGDLHGAVTPHPFDSHPPLSARLENVGQVLEPDDVVRVLLEPSTTSWVGAILDADAIEGRLWGAYEARFAEAHDMALAYRYVPSTEEERRHVEKHFPPVTFTGKKEGLEVRLDFERLHCTEWAEPVVLAQVGTVGVDERMFKKYLEIKLKDSGVFGGRLSFCLSNLDYPDALLEAFGRYLGRQRAMEEHQQSLRQAA